MNYDIISVILIALFGALGLGFLIGRGGRDELVRPRSERDDREPEFELPPPNRTASEVRNDLRETHRDAVDAAAAAHGRDPDDVDEILEWADDNRKPR